MIGTLIAAWLDVRTRPFRTLAAIAGMVAAVVAVVLVDAAAVLSRDANATYLARQYGLPVTVAISSTGGSTTSEQAADLATLLRSNGVTALSQDVSVPGAVSFRGQRISDGMRLLWSPYELIRIVDLVAGSWPTQTATSETLHVVVHEGFGQRMLGMTDQQAIGQVLTYDTNADRVSYPEVMPHRSMVIDGVVATDSSAFRTGSPSVIIVSDRPPPNLLPSLVSPQWIARVNPDEFGMLQETIALLTDGDGVPLYRLDRADATDTLAPVLEQQSVTAGIVTIVALTVGGLGILGVGVAGVRERARDFGLRRALGASRLRLFSSVIVQTVLEVLLATLVAIPLAAVLLELYARDLVLETLPLPPSTALPLSSATLGLLGALAVGLLAGLIPAVNAARTSVVRALQG